MIHLKRLVVAIPLLETGKDEWLVTSQGIIEPNQMILATVAQERRTTRLEPTSE